MLARTTIIIILNYIIIINTIVNRFGGSVGLVPGMYLTKNTERTSLPFSRSASYSIGFNASQLSEPPPRRYTNDCFYTYTDTCTVLTRSCSNN